MKTNTKGDITKATKEADCFCQLPGNSFGSRLLRVVGFVVFILFLVYIMLRFWQLCAIMLSGGVHVAGK